MTKNILMTETPINIKIVKKINEYGVPYSLIEELLNTPPASLRQAMRKAGYEAATKGSDFRKALSDEQVEAIQEAYAYGVPSPLLAIIAKVSPPTIRYHIRGMRGRVLSTAQIEIIARLAGAGVMQGDLAVLVNIHPAAVSAAIKRSGKND